MSRNPQNRSVRRAISAAAAVVLLSSLVPAASSAEEPWPWLDTSLDPDTRADMIIAEMTLEEKSRLLYGQGTLVIDGERWQVYVPGIPRLGIPNFTQGDSPVQITQGSTAITQMPSGTALGATFSRDVAKTYGDALGADAYGLGYMVLHGPNLDTNRDPRHGRAFEGMGEDPFLTGELGVEYVKAVQARGVIADAKHFVVNTVEQGRQGIDAQIDERTLHELYIPAFKAVVEDADIGMLMCSYNRINGVFACDHADLLQELIRDTWGFEGIIRTDAGAGHEMSSLWGGLDTEFRSGRWFDQDLIDAVNAGTVPIAYVDNAVLHILRTMIKYGVFDNPPQRTGTDVIGGAAKAQQVAEQAIVLLRNEGNLLPLDPESTDRIAVIGVNANDTGTAGGPSNNGDLKDTMVQGIQDRVPGATVTYDKGVDPIWAGVSVAAGYPQVPSGALTTEGGDPGATGSYFRNDGTVITTRTDTCLCVTGGGGFAGGLTTSQQAPGGTASVTWTATLTADLAGTYGFDITTNASSQLYVDDVLIVDSTGSGGVPVASSVALTEGEHDLRLEHRSGQIKVGWQPPAGAFDANMKAAAASAADADVTVVVVRDLESEGLDRPNLSLPNDQDRLIEAVAQANPNTVVALTTGAPVTMPWNDAVPAILEAWYGGTRQGASLAAVLFGDVNPSGHLPFSFPIRDEDMPTYASEQFPGVDVPGVGRVGVYSEGLATGYRYYGQPGSPEPLYPFGYGLSYSSFRYTNFEITPSALKSAQDATVTATFDVTNTGNVAGADAPQIYIEFPAAAGEPAPLLKGFDKVYLEPGQTKTVTIELEKDDFSIYSVAKGGWTVVPGKYIVHLGYSSADTAKTHPVNVK